MKKAFLLGVAVIFLMGAVWGSGAEANLITNGNFATDATGWIYNNQGIDGGYQSSIGNLAGSFWINHNGGNVGSDPDPMLSQTISTVAGSFYELIFDYSPYIIAGGIGLALDINGTNQAAYSLIPGTGWVTESWVFEASGAATTIAFRSEINGTDFDALIDNVSVNPYHQQSPVPEPSTILLLGFGLVGLAGVAGKKLRK